MNYAVSFYPTPATLSGNYFDHNVLHNMKGGGVATQYDPTGSFTVGTNYTLTPDILGSGNRWTTYYGPNGPNSNLVDRGTVVGLPYSGTAPDIGPYEYEVPPAAPTGLKLTPQ